MIKNEDEIQKDLETFKLLCSAYWKKRTQTPIEDAELSETDALWTMVSVLIRLVEVLG